MKILRLAIVIVSIGASSFGSGPVSLPRTSVHELKAKSNGVEYALYVSLPRDYETSTERYPVIYTLDADYSFAIAHNVVEHLADRGHLRWAIVVGVAYRDPALYRVNRTRDYTPTHTLEGGPPHQRPFQKYTGGGSLFRRALAEEIIPLVDRSYRTTGERVLSGHSYGGLFGTWTLLTTDLFTGYIVISPSYWFDDAMIFEVERRLARAPKGRLYLAAGEMEDPVMARDVRRMAARLRRFTTFELRSEVLEGETHNSIFPGAFSRGLRYVLNGR